MGLPSGVLRANELFDQTNSPIPSTWCLEAVAGRFVELCGAAGTAALTVAAGLVIQAQQRGLLAVWVTGLRSTFYPPDFAASGIDVRALPVVRVEGDTKIWQAADTLLRSGAFGLVVLDPGLPAKLPLAMQTRLVGLAKKHAVALLLITRHAPRETPQGSLVSLRGETDKHRVGHDCFRCTVRAVKDKRLAPGWSHAEMCRGADGLC